MKKTIAIFVTLAALAAIGWVLLAPKDVDVAITTSRFVVDVQVPELAGNAIVGARIYDAKCSVCHGENAGGLDGVGPPLVHKIYEPSHHGDMSFLMAVRNGVQSHHWRYGNMAPVEGLSDGEVAMIVDYIRALQRANGIN